MRRARPIPRCRRGTWCWQDPPAALELPSGSIVELTLSDGPAQLPVPDVMYFDLEEARRVMTAAGLAVGGIDSVPADTDRGVVVSTRPPEGTLRPPGARVDLVVSRGPAAVRIPEVTGLTEIVARERIEAAGLRIGLVSVAARRPRTARHRPQPAAQSRLISSQGRTRGPGGERREGTVSPRIAPSVLSADLVAAPRAGRGGRRGWSGLDARGRDGRPLRAQPHLRRAGDSRAPQGDRPAARRASDGAANPSTTFHGIGTPGPGSSRFTPRPRPTCSGSWPRSATRGCRRDLP